MKKLLVESTNDSHFISHLFEKSTNSKKRFEIINCENISNLINRIPAELIASDTEVLGIVVDADQNLSKRWIELKKQFEKYGYQFSDIPQPEGEMLDKQGFYPKVGIWLMPDNLKTGILEDFITEIIPENDKLKPIVAGVLNDIESQELHLYKDIYRPKAFIHTWLAWQDEPGKPFGWAVTKRYFDLNASLAQTFVLWLKRVFE
jgi:hypothetical protein